MKSRTRMWVLIDNYDSFTFILQQYLQMTGYDCRVLRNDELTVDELQQLNPERIIISPGPETPSKAGICMEMIERFHQSTPILGICLGHQALGQYFGADLVHAAYPMHGKTSMVQAKDHPLFADIPVPFSVMRYHSLVIENIEGAELEAIAHATDDNAVMALAHKRFPAVGIQFHPESVGTDAGLQILTNWTRMRFNSI